MLQRHIGDALVYSRRANNCASNHGCLRELLWGCAKRRGDRLLAELAEVLRDALQRGSVDRIKLGAAFAAPHIQHLHVNHEL